VDLAWYKGGQLAVLAAPRAPLGGAARASAGAEPAGGAARLLLLPWDAAHMRRLELRPGMATVLLQARRSHFVRQVSCVRWPRADVMGRSGTADVVTEGPCALVPSGREFSTRRPSLQAAAWPAELPAGARARPLGYAAAAAPLAVSGPRGVACVVAGVQRALLLDLEEDEEVGDGGNDDADDDDNEAAALDED
jgi:hypothetical protein